ncbi:uncharacterized protein LOC134835428 [Culicoides brevitarsis]|uniref:uncharacterized protein LOC134835428 n=1 Tax=Culicoides brevitarsis TaxID=469753 RepID=UPI00307B9AD4
MLIVAEPPSGYSFSRPPNSLPPLLPTVSNSYGPPPNPPMESYGPPQLPKDTYGPPSQAAIIHKHVYVHVAPPEPEYEQPRPYVAQPPVQKHYKIVFIKAPNPPRPRPPQIAVPPQNEEKTLVYVLVKKPDDPPEIMIPTPAPTMPSKPEVYFIRYRTQKQEGSNGGGGYAESISPADQYGQISLTNDQRAKRHRHQ